MLKRLQATTVVVTSLGFLAALLAAVADTRAAYLILAAAVANVAEWFVARKGTDEFSRRLGSMGAFVAFGVAPAVFVLDVVLAVNQALLVLPLLYLLAVAITLTRYDLSGRTGLPAVANGFVVPGLFIGNFFTFPLVAGWLILASALMAFELRTRPRRQAEYVVKAPEEKKDVPEGFVPLSEL